MRDLSGLAEMSVAELLGADGISSWLQPIVRLDSREVVAVEALARGPVGGDLHLPGSLFQAATAEGLVTELEWGCRKAAYRSAATAGLAPGVCVFVNVESAQLGAPPPAEVAEAAQRLRGRRIVLELTERQLVRRPADVLRAVYAARSQGWGIALDDVGAEPESLALMPVLRPDVVKLDMGLVQRRATRETGRIASAVASYAEESGATVLAEGIEDELHFERAIALGATLGQGWLFAHPRPPADVQVAEPSEPIALLDEPAMAPHATPFELVGQHLQTRVARKGQLLAMSHHLERQTSDLPTPPLLLAAFEHARHFTTATARRYREYGRRSSLVAAFGEGLDQQPELGVRGASLDSDDPLSCEWTVVVLGSHFAGALIARDLGDGGVDRERRFEFAITHRRDHVTAAARCLIARIAAQ